MSRKVFSTWVDQEILKAIEQRCQALGITKSRYIRKLIADDLGLKSEIHEKIQAIREEPIPVVRDSQNPGDYFHVDKKKEEEWRRRRKYENPPFERPTAIF